MHEDQVEVNQGLLFVVLCEKYLYCSTWKCWIRCL